jgi:hypothetical protein
MNYELFITIKDKKEFVIYKQINKLPVVEQRGILYLSRVAAPLRLSALARREGKAGEFFLCVASGEELTLKPPLAD